LLFGSGLKSINSVAKAINSLKKAGFIVVIRKARPHHSAAYQIQWELMAEMQRRWEAEYLIEMARRRRRRAVEVVAFKGRGILKPTDVLVVGRGAPKRASKWRAA
jgi:hypothetical protein